MNERPQLTVGSLFSGIGGFDLGLERAGMRVIWQSEIDPYASAVLRKHWPTVPNLGDVRGISRVERPDVLCGGFPCQPFSSAGRGRNRRTADNFLWPSMRRIVAFARPTWVIGENVTHFKRVELEKVVSDLERLDYEVQALAVPACAVGLDHRRERYWILGHANGHGESGMPLDVEVAGLSWADNDPAGVGAAHGISGGLDANRMRCLGNSIVPQIAEIIGRAIIEAEEAKC